MKNSRKTNELVGKHTPLEIAELLDSDDELPDSYVETPDIPAYLDDNRFAKLKVADTQYDGKIILEVNSSEQQSCMGQAVEEITTEYSTSSELPQVSQSADISDWRQQITTKETSKKKILISKGFFTKCDIFLIKSIEEYSTTTTLLWFINFLSSKVVKPTQSSCLVQDITSADFIEPEPCHLNFKRCYMKILVN